MANEVTPRQKAVLAALAAGADGSIAPVQVQKLFFLLDENASVPLGGPLYDFRPYNYGPFDAEVYRDLAQLKSSGLILITGDRGQRRYSLTTIGRQTGNAALEEFSPGLKNYMTALANWVRSLSFADLVGSIYRAYPRMRERSIFQD